MTSAEYFDRDGRRIDWKRCAELGCDPEYSKVAQTVNHGYRISTDWLGMAQRNWLNPPLTFETMIFDSDGWPALGPYLDAYPTEAAAREGHGRAEEYLREYLRGLPDDDA